MDANNQRNPERLFGPSEKFRPVYAFTPDITEIEDPWYTDRFDLVFQEIKKCVEDILKALDNQAL